MTIPPSVLLAAIAEDMLAYTRALRDPALQHNAYLTHSVLAVLAQDVDRLADRLHDENLAVAAILRDAIPLLPGQLADQARSLIEADRSPSLRISVLQERNDRLRSALIDVHAAIEEIEGDAARALDERIWEEYRLSVRRRHVEVPQ